MDIHYRLHNCFHGWIDMTIPLSPQREKKMEKLTSLEQLQVGTRLKIVGKSSTDSYESISVKKLIPMEGDDGRKWTEVLINKTYNYYFHLENYLAGYSQWVKEVFVLPGTDRRLSSSSLNLEKGEI